MKVKHLFGGVVAVGGGLGLAWSVALLLAGANSCGDVGQRVCPAGAGQVGGVLPVSVVALLIAPFLIKLLSVVLAGGAGGMLLFVFAGADTYGEGHGELISAFVFIGVPAALFILLVIAGISVTSRETAKEQFKQRAVQVAGVVTEVADTGMTINDDPRVKLTVRYCRTDGTTATATKRMTVSRLRIPRPGEAVTVWYDPQGTEVLVERTEPEPALDAVPAVPAVPEAPEPQAALTAFAPADESADPIGLVSALERLTVLHRDGTLTAEEFTRAKERLLGGEARPAGPFDAGLA